MKSSSIALLMLLASTITGFAQGYQAQYPYDPYGGAPQPTPPPRQVPPPQYGPQGYSQQPGAADYKSLLTYGSLEAHYGYTSFSNGLSLKNSSAFGANLNMALLKPLFVHVGVNWLRGGTDGGSDKGLKMTSVSLGGGAYIPFTDRFHIFGEVGFRYDVVNGATSISKDDLAVYVRPGIRYAVTDKFELAADVTLNSTKNLNDRVYGISGFYNLFDILDLGLGVDISPDVNTYRGGVRLHW